MTALKNPVPLSVAEYLEGEARSDVKHEYLGGVVHAMAGGTNRHNAIALNSLISLGNQLEGKGCQPFNSDTKVRIGYGDHTRFYYPDAMVVCEPSDESAYFQDKPVVIVEVLSESTGRYDLFEKRDAYITLPSLKVLLLVEQKSPSVTVWRRGAGGGFETEHFGGLDAEIPLPEIGAKLRLDAIYRRVAFEDV